MHNLIKTTYLLVILLFFVNFVSAHHLTASTSFDVVHLPDVWTNKIAYSNEKVADRNFPENFENYSISFQHVDNADVNFTFRRGKHLNFNPYATDLLEGTLYQLEEQIYACATDSGQDIELFKASFRISIFDFNEEFMKLGLGPICKFDPIMSRKIINGREWLQVKMETFVLHFTYDASKATKRSNYAATPLTVCLYYCLIGNHLYQAHFKAPYENFEVYEACFEETMNELIFLSP